MSAILRTIAYLPRAAEITASERGRLHPREAQGEKNNIVALMQRVLIKFTVMDAQHLICPHHTIWDWFSFVHFISEEM